MYTQTEALDKLKALLPSDTVIYNVVRHVSKSGMSRRISFFIIEDGCRIRNIDHLLVMAGFGKRRGNEEGLYIQGTGMDMAFATVYNISMELFNHGYSLNSENL